MHVKDFLSNDGLAPACFNRGLLNRGNNQLELVPSSSQAKIWEHRRQARPAVQSQAILNGAAKMHPPPGPARHHWQSLVITKPFKMFAFEPDIQLRPLVPSNKHHIRKALVKETGEEEE